MVKIVCIVGSKKSGKTSLIMRLVAQFRGKGYLVGVMKNSHAPLDLETPGTDTWKFREAGALRVMLTWPGGAAMPHFSTEESEMPQHIVRLTMDDMDLVLVEGYTQSSLPKILLAGNDPGIEVNRRGLIATVGMGGGTGEIPDFDRDDIAGIAARIEEHFQWSERRKDLDIELRVNGKKIGLKGFVRDFLSGAIVGMVGSLKGCEDPEKIEITLDLKAAGKSQKTKE
jgi:molybdopterin-guanine dinucleotide biosynthesis protein B